MKIDITRLKENQAQDFQESIAASTLDLDTEDVQYKDNVDIRAEVRKEMGVLYTKSHFSGEVECTCSRCLSVFTLNIERDFDIKYPIEKSQKMNLQEELKNSLVYQKRIIEIFMV